MTALWDEARLRIGRVHTVVGIIGMSKYQELLACADEDWEWHRNLVLRHALLALQLGGAQVAREGGGTFTFVASASGLTGAPMHAAYSAAKAALMSWSAPPRSNSGRPAYASTPSLPALCGHRASPPTSARRAARRPRRTLDCTTLPCPETAKRATTAARTGEVSGVRLKDVDLP